MQGIFIGPRRPKSKKEVKESIASDATIVRAEATSLHGGEYDGRISEAPAGTKIHFVGPDPYNNRKFYGTILVTEKGIKVS